jgi:hypothetical protein
VAADPNVNQFGSTSLSNAARPSVKADNVWASQAETQGASSWTV